MGYFGQIFDLIWCKFMKKIKTKSYLYLTALSVIAGCGGGGDPEPVVVSQGPSVGGGVVIQPPTIPPAPPPPPTTLPPATPAPPPSGPIDVSNPPVTPSPAPSPDPGQPSTGSSSTDYSWMNSEKETSYDSEPVLVAQLDTQRFQQPNVISVEDRRKQIEQEMEAERLAMEKYHKKQMDELMDLEIKMRATEKKLQENVSLNWLGLKDNLSVLYFDRINTPGEEALPCDYAHMAFIKDKELGVVNVGELIDWSIVSKSENNYKGWFFVVSPFVFNDDLKYFKAVEDETHLLWARRISDKELVVKPAGSPWENSQNFKTNDGYKNVRISYDGVALPVLAIDRLIAKPMPRLEFDVCQPKN